MVQLIIGDKTWKKYKISQESGSRYFCSRLHIRIRAVLFLYMFIQSLDPPISETVHSFPMGGFF